LHTNLGRNRQTHTYTGSHTFNIPSVIPGNIYVHLYIFNVPFDPELIYSLRLLEHPYPQYNIYPLIQLTICVRSNVFVQVLLLVTSKNKISLTAYKVFPHKNEITSLSLIDKCQIIIKNYELL